MGTLEKHQIRIRILVVGIFFAAVLTVIGGKAVYLQVFLGKKLSERAANQYERSFDAKGKRGTIFDTNKEALAVSIDGASIAVTPRAMVADKSGAARKLASALGVKPATVRRKLASKKSFVWLKRKVTPKQAEVVKALDIDGVHFVTEHSRFYPNRTLAAQTLGFSGLDSRGLEGLEFYYNKVLESPKDNFTVMRDALGRSMDGEGLSVVARDGNNLVLTIDRTIQYITEEAVRKAAEEFDAKTAMAVVMDPDTGAVLALAHYPRFNPNAFSGFNREDWRNRAITDPYEPGSTMKIFLAATAIESGYCSPDSIFYCEDGKYRVGRNIVNDTHPHEWLSLSQIIKFSSNIGVVKVVETIGAKTLYDSLRGFGFGSKTGIDCPGETAGSLSNYKGWTKIDTGTIAFGQGIAVSAIQTVAAASAIANGGTLFRPRLVSAVTDKSGRTITEFPAEKVRRVISADTAQKVRRMMHSVVTEGGTGTNAALDNYAVCGKTGTAQKVDETGRYAKNRYVSSFLGLVPMEKPELTVLVVLDEPRNKHYGGTVAAPAFKEIAGSTLNYLNIAPRRVAETHGSALHKENSG